jgi:hypothetical protein
MIVLVEGPETVIARFTPIPGPTYFEDPSASTATITIIDNDTAPPRTVVSIFAEDPIATEFPEVTIPEIQPDQARFRISRTGDLSRELRVFFPIGGSANPSQDYRISPLAIRPPSPCLSRRAPTQSCSDVFAREDNAAEGMETVLIRLAPSPLAGPLPTYEINRAQDFAVAGIFDQGEQARSRNCRAARRRSSSAATSIDIIFAAFHPTEFVTGADLYAGPRRLGKSGFRFQYPRMVRHWILRSIASHGLSPRQAHIRSQFVPCRVRKPSSQPQRP